MVRCPEGEISDVTVGGGGRYLILTLGDVHKVAVFDVNAAEFVKTISVSWIPSRSPFSKQA